MQFNLATAHGRAQAYCTSAEGAEQVRLLEEQEEVLREQYGEQLNVPAHSIIHDAQFILDELQDINYDAQIERFKKTLTLKQRAGFNRILRQRRKKEEDILNSLVHIQLAAEKIKEIFKML